ncbi:hypothetical protein LCGC14_2034610 [marine sediment metagenome]|uniref:PD-(D/E)XK endonuclease-like domain-containing protein n=1 Tax=marine sediment metagenome TaxID=412755 RepID=A0A0F9FG86_9ZZZZ
MLSEVLEAYAPIMEKSKKPHAPGISMSSLFPCPYRLYMVHTGGMYKDREWTPQQIWNMNDGWDQEAQSIKRLAKAGIKIIDRQKRVVVGKSMVPGTIDGAFILDGTRRLWEHKAYDANSDALRTLLIGGMNRLPSQKAQINGYMLGDGSNEGVFFVKVKNNNTYVDRLIRIDKPFIEEIVEWCDKIRAEKWVPQPVECKWCSLCGIDCFGSVIDFSLITEASSDEMVDRWKKGKQFVGIGEMMMEEADEVFIGVKDASSKIIQPGLIGDRELLILPGLEITKGVQHRFNISKQLVLQEFGPTGLIKVGQYKDITQYKHKET